MSKKASIIILYSIAIFLIIYAIFTIIAGFVREGADTVLDAVVCILVCAVTCAIIYFACRNARTETPNPRKKHRQKPIEKQTKFSASAIALFCAIAAGACVFYGLGIAGAVKLYGEDYVKTTAQLINDKHSLFYEYYAYGKKFIQNAHVSFFGIYLPEGNIAEIFISASDPQVVKTFADPVLFFVLGTFFASAVVLCILLNKNKPLHISLVVAVMFLNLGGGLSAMFAVMFGFGFISLFTSGALIYCLSVFIIFGLYFLTGYFYGLINSFRGI